MMKFIVYNRTDTWKIHIHLFFMTTNCQIVCSRSLLHRINYKFMFLSTYNLKIKISQWARENMCCYRKKRVSSNMLMESLWLYCLLSLIQGLCMVLEASCKNGGTILFNLVDNLLSGLHAMVCLNYLKDKFCLSQREDISVVMSAVMQIFSKYYFTKIWIKLHNFMQCCRNRWTLLSYEFISAIWHCVLLYSILVWTGFDHMNFVI